MILGLSIAAFTQLHTAISLIAIALGVLALVGWVAGQWRGPLNLSFLIMTILTSVTGFMFPITVIGPPFIVGVISLVVLAIALAALYGFKLAARWRVVYIASATFALYLNAFVAVVQAFQKLPPLAVLAPTQTEPPFLIAQAVTLVTFVALGVLATRHLRVS